MLAICTGMSGSGRNECIEAIRKLADRRGKELLEVRIGDLMYKKSEELGYSIPNGSILNISERNLDYLRAAVFEEVIKLKKDTPNLVINTLDDIFKN